MTSDLAPSSSSQKGAPETQKENQHNESSAQPVVRKSLFTDESAQAIASHWNATSDGDTEFQSYKRWSIFAIVACLIGILSLSGFLYVECFFISFLGMIFSLIAYLVILHSQNTLIGARVALLGFGLSLFSCAGVATTWTYYQYTVRKEADRFFHIWFDVVKSKDMRLIQEMKGPTWSRQIDSTNEEWWKSKLDIQNREMRGEILEGFLGNLNHPCMRTLMALGSDADISYYKTTSNFYHNSQDRVSTIYAVTFTNPDNNERETFFMRISGTRVKNPNNKKQLGWALSDFPSFILPEEFSQEQTPTKDVDKVDAAT